MKIAVVVDSTSYLPRGLKEKYDIRTIPLNVIIGEQSYKEGEDIDNETFFDSMREMEKLPRTSQPSIGDYILLLESLRSEGCTDVISVHLSSQISGTYQNAMAAGQSVEGIEVHAIDSEIACYVQGFLALYAAQNKDRMPLDDLLLQLEEMKRRKHTNAYFIVDTLSNLQKGGRLTNAQALIGSLLKVKPILEFQDGRIVPFEKIRTKRKAMKRVEEVFADEMALHKGKPVTAVVIHSNAEKEGQQWMESLQQQYPEITFRLSYFGPVIATHLGEGALGLGYTTYEVDTAY
ncbi:DegV family protein [Salinicoccus hispanicus]|uniref:DegV family EDD domain-containing protein n=1 Tax=Salinicoccus hispanicus TaxID=157225 RepID=A0A6N8U559_9STAP|nr:DegV family protein [Salinicoccus hispanicus]MXQ50729.1 DegV family EDD domain-containing protein [Salinicoccus hispanicus]